MVNNIIWGVLDLIGWRQVVWFVGLVIEGCKMFMMSALRFDGMKHIFLMR